ncbi:MAG: LPS export ABC transporter periplasmic protein LptC [Sulfuritalea sp.]|nr:LPS export ABC transporter periplasmic protein LptC [Sulfuritalea sp.]
MGRSHGGVPWHEGPPQHLAVPAGHAGAARGPDLLAQPGDRGEKPRGPQRHDPDYWVENFEVRRFDIDGKLQHTLIAKKLVHYPDDDTTIVTAPQLTYHRGAPAEISARMAYVGTDGKEIDLVDDVRVSPPRRDGRRAADRAGNPGTGKSFPMPKGTHRRAGTHHPGQERPARQRTRVRQQNRHHGPARTRHRHLHSNRTEKP